MRFPFGGAPHIRTFCFQIGNCMYLIKKKKKKLFLLRKSLSSTCLPDSQFVQLQLLASTDSLNIRLPRDGLHRHICVHSPFETPFIACCIHCSAFCFFLFSSQCSVLFNTCLIEIRGEGNDTPLQYCCPENPMDGGAWQSAVHGVAKSQTPLSDLTFTFHFHALEKEMATHSSVLAWRIPGTGEPGGLQSMGSHRVRHD